jgi:hypothetical protein
MQKTTGPVPQRDLRKPYMRILVVLSAEAYPKDVGKRIMVGGMCDYLQQSASVDSICIASFASDGPRTATRQVVKLPRPSSRQKLANLLWHTCLRGNKSIQESLFWNPGAQKSLDSLVKEFQPDVVLYDTMRTGQYCRRVFQQSPAHFQIIYMDDLFSLRYERMLEAMDRHRLSGLNAIGNFGENVPGFLLNLYQRIPALQKLALKIERRLVAASEDQVPSRFHRALLVSTAEQTLLLNRTKADNIFSIPPRLDTSTHNKRAWNGRPEFVFLGSLNLAHNAISLESFLESYFQVLRHLIPDIRISIVGKGAGANLKRLASLYPDNIFLHGFVKDIDEILLRCCAMISPLTFGSGVKLKALDSLRCGTPLISTLCGVEGIETGSSRGVLKGEVQAFPAMMLQMLNPERNAAASRDNAELYRHFYSLGAVDQVYHQLLLNTQNFTTTPVPVPVAS